ncbi:MAG TPA: hypothetical protein VEF76_11735 [Patescibacteria group bacterium]|nr:hypothetical protein [Patescibacteria group bacterium]
MDLDFVDLVSGSVKLQVSQRRAVKTKFGAFKQRFTKTRGAHLGLQNRFKEEKQTYENG